MKTDLTTELKDTMPIAAIAEQVNLIGQVLKQVMKKDVHFGAIPGCGDKPVLLKPGAEKLNLLFKLSPELEIDEREMINGHREYRIKCNLHNQHDRIVGSGLGSATTMESKWRFRYENTGRPVPKDYWKTRNADLLGGSGLQAKKIQGNWMICARVENDNPADYYNTALKIAKKRAMVDAVLTTTAASDIFEMDMEDYVDPSTGETYGPAAQAQHEYVQDNQVSQQADIDASWGEEMNKKPPYPQEKFDKESQAWAKLINSGKKSPSQIIKTISSKYELSIEQQDAICNLREENQ